MYHLKIASVTLFTLLVLFFLHIYGMAENLYLNYWFYDILLHILGGISIALSVFCISEFLNIKIIKDNLWTLILLTFFAGIGWEVFEVYYNIAGHPFGTYAYNLDTIKDLIDDTIGALIVWSIIKFKNK